MYIVLICLTIAMFMPLFLALGSIVFRIKQFNKLDIQNPRIEGDKLTGAGQRIVAAQANAWEALGLFISALIIAKFSGVNFDLITTPVVLFIAARIGHAIFYISGIGALRFISFFISVINLIWIISLAFQAI